MRRPKPAEDRRTATYLPGPTSTGYHFPILGWRGSIRPHGKKYGNGTPHAWDGSARSGTPVVAVIRGTIIQIGRGQEKAGTSLHLRGSDGRYYYYCHLQMIAPGIRVGRIVGGGQIIGRVGSTGNATGPHLHFCIGTRKTTNGGGDIDCLPLLLAWQHNRPVPVSGSSLPLESEPLERWPWAV